MLTEKDLLLDIIQNTPEYSVWNISSDSWERIPEVFSEFISLNDVYGWDITIRSDNRKQIMEIIDREEIFDKIVHQHISSFGNIILNSYDNMSFTTLEDSFPSKSELLNKYKDGNVCVE
jgi:hypothetical protein